MATAVAGAAGGTVGGFQQMLLIGWGRTATFAATFAAAVAFGSYGRWVVNHPVFLAALAAWAPVSRCPRPCDCASVRSIGEADF